MGITGEPLSSLLFSALTQSLVVATEDDPSRDFISQEDSGREESTGAASRSLAPPRQHQEEIVRR